MGAAAKHSGALLPSIVRLLPPESKAGLDHRIRGQQTPRCGILPSFHNITCSHMQSTRNALQCLQHHRISHVTAPCMLTRIDYNEAKASNRQWTAGSVQKCTARSAEH